MMEKLCYRRSLKACHCVLLFFSGDAFKSIIITETDTNCNSRLVECPEIQTVQERTREDLLTVPGNSDTSERGRFLTFVENWKSCSSRQEKKNNLQC